MHCFEESRKIAVSAQTMFELVMDIKAYPAFVPWVAETHILSHSEHELSAEVCIDLAGMRHTFQTIDRFTPHKCIEIRLLSGPFRCLESLWTFEALSDTSCLVHFSIEFEFKSQVLDFIASPLFATACKTMVKTFEKRALNLPSQAPLNNPH
ncbi:MAG: type II toxin-antitoxin system RatA family toxin [Mariprofundaceae bacterium]|nr:type II toxin-antitoxin system RatA family toxin [Mariprofundaceae bacterium]